MIAARFVKTLNVQVGMSLRVLVRIEVHEAPNSFAKVVCNLLPDAMLYVSEILPTPDKAVLWTKVEAGWIQATDGGEISLVEIINDPDVIQHAKADQAEKRQRMASAVAAMLIKSYSLPRAKRLARAILKHATTHYPQTALLKITDLSIDNIMIILNGQSGLTKAQVFEYVKAAAARQTNPLDAVITISQTIFDIICSRPSIWVKDDLNVITTEDIRIRNNRFIMSAAEGHMELFRQFIENKQELTCLHSELHYTALHAAADFGQCAIINYIISLGFSLDIKDPKHGQTALHYAAWGGRTEVAKILIDAGANRQLPCNKGILPYQAADKMGHIPCREVLKFLPPTVQHIEFTDVTLNSVSVIWKIPNMNRDHYAKIDQFCLEFQIVDTMDDLRDPDIVYTTLLHWQYKNLTPFRTHRIRIKAQSVSGWSAWSSWVYCKTLAFQPTPPEPVEVLKVTYNAMLLHWFPPIRENGFPTLFYELEIADYKHVVEGKLPTIESEPIIPEVDQTTAAPAVATENLPNAPVRKNRRQSQQTTGKPLTQTGEGEGAAGTKSKESVGVVSKIHRLLKHKDVKHLSRYVTGLEPNRLYQTRIRAYNELGFSLWSAWSTPIAPKVGVMVADFRMQDQAAVIQWFKPDLGKKRAIECYELQLCRLTGPITVSLSTVTHNNREQTKALGAGLEEFVTLDKNIPTNEYTIYKLKAGDRYKIRVRCKLVDEEWPDWDHSMQSDPFAMPATMPNPPIHIRPFALNSKLTKDAEDGNPETMEGESQAGMDDMDSLQDQSDMTIAQSQASSYYAPEDRVKLTDDLDITHEYITITWTNGDSNGENIIEYNIEMARVRTYNPRDVIFARDAFLGVGTAETEDDYDRNFNYKVTSVESPSKSGKDYASEVIEWEDITKLGTFLAPQVFRAVNLYPGNAYTFRVKQKNKCGWSKISKASPLMCTHPSVPPATLYLLQVKDTFSVICWDEVEYKQSSLTTLEYQIQIRSLYSRLEEGKSKEAQYEKDWEDADARLMQPAELKHYITNSDFMETLMHPRKAGKQSGCMIRNLVELHWYIARVRVRSVIGWSPWSQATESFRTLR